MEEDCAEKEPLVLEEEEVFTEEVQQDPVKEEILQDEGEQINMDPGEGESTADVALKAEGEEGLGVEVTAEEASPSPPAEEAALQAAAVAAADGGDEDGPQQQIFIIQTTDGSIPMEAGEVVVADDLAVYETVSALEQLSRGNVVTTAAGEGGELIQVYEEVVLPDGTSGSIIDQFVDVAEVEVGEGNAPPPLPPPTKAKGPKKPRGKGKKAAASAASASSSSAATTAATSSSSSGNHIVTVGGGAAGPEFHICRLCNTFVSLEEIADHNRAHHGAAGELTCADCGKLFKSKRSLFGHRKEKHSGVTEVHHCPECGKSFGRKSNLKAHRESLHYGKKFPCSFCERIFTNRSSMNQHIKKTHNVPGAVIFQQQE